MREQVVGSIVFDPELCNGCGVCVETCRSRARRISPELNRHGIHPAQFLGEACVSCGTCHYFCPELGAITVVRRKAPGREGRYVPAA